MKKKFIVSSLLAMIMCLSLMTGATYALFTSEASVNVAVTSATVQVTATVNGFKTYSMDEEMAQGTFENGGTATLADNTLTLTNVTPGDRAQLTIALKNDSNVAVKYQILVVESGDAKLVEGLELIVKDGENALAGVVNGNKLITAWAKLDPVTAEDKTFKTLTVSIGLPESAGNVYQTLTSSLTVSVTAVQGNATTVDPTPEVQGVTNIYTAEDLASFAAAVNAGKTFSGETVNLLADINLGGAAWTPIGNGSVLGQDAKGNDVKATFKGTFDGYGYTVSNFNVTGTTQIGLFGSVIGSIKNVKVDDATLTGTHYVGGIVGYMYGNITGCSVTNATITCSDSSVEDGDKVGGIVGYHAELYGSSYYLTGCTVKNVTISANRDAGFIAGMKYFGSATVQTDFVNNNVWENVTVTHNGYGSGANLAANHDGQIGRIGFHG